MERFEAIKLHNEPYDFLVIATSYENPLDEIDEIRSKLDKDEADVLVDLMLINGTKQNRFIELRFKKGLNIPDYSLEDHVTDNIRKISSDFFVHNREMVDNSVLPKSLKYLIKQNLISTL
jgi:hypothetical protein